MKTIFSIILIAVFSMTVFGQQDWSKVDFFDEYKGKVKIGGASAKALKENKIFVNYYTVGQATTMKGSEKSATKAVYSEVSLAGLENAAYQQMVDELYRQLLAELEAAGLQITNGDDVLNSGYAQERLAKGKKDEHIKKTGANPAYEGKMKITEGAMPGYGAWAVTRDITFPPGNANIYYTDDIIKAGNFYQKLATKENFNLLSIQFFVSFASFDGGRGYKDISLATNPVLAISATVKLITPNGAANTIFFKDFPVWAGSEWSEGIEKGKDNKNSAEAFGLARSAEYEIRANSDRYLNEVKDIISNLQKDIVEGIKTSL
jgi:hypothetical protein